SLDDDFSKTSARLFTGYPLTLTHSDGGALPASKCSTPTGVRLPACCARCSFHPAAPTKPSPTSATTMPASALPNRLSVGVAPAVAVPAAAPNIEGPPNQSRTGSVSSASASQTARKVNTNVSFSEYDPVQRSCSSASHWK